MAGHVHIVTRKTKDGDARYLVRARRGGRGFPIVHCGSFRTMPLARERANLVAGWLVGFERRNRNEASTVSNPDLPGITTRAVPRGVRAGVLSGVR